MRVFDITTPRFWIVCFFRRAYGVPRIEILGYPVSRPGVWHFAKLCQWEREGFFADDRGSEHGP